MLTLAFVKRAALGFFSGVRALFGGIGFIVSTPSAWGWSWIPILVATALFGGTAAGAIWGANELSARLLAGSTTTSEIGMWVARVVLWVVGIVVAFIVAISLAQPLSGFALERLVRKQELALGGRTWPDGPFLAGALRSLRVSLTSLVLGLPVLALLALITFVAPPAAVVTVPLKFVVAGLMAAYDFLDYPFSVRGAGVRERLAWMKDHLSSVLGFGCAIAAILLVPGVGLLLLPFGVAGATRLVVQSGRS